MNSFAAELAEAAWQLGAGEGRFRLPVESAFLALGGSLIRMVKPGLLTRQFLSAHEQDGETWRPNQFFLGRGSWEPALRPVARTTVYREMEELAAGKPWRQTGSYRRTMDLLRAGRPRMRNRMAFDSEEKIEAYFEGMLELLAGMRARGYRMRPQPDLSLAAAFSPNAVRSRLQEAEERHIGVALDADGALLRVGPGQHRLAAAQLAGVPEVPVEIRLVHLEALSAATEPAIRAAIARIGGDPPFGD